MTDPSLTEIDIRIIADFTYDWEFWRNEQGRFMYVSPACQRISGYVAEEFLKDPDLYLRGVHPDDRAAVQSHMVHEELDRHGQEQQMEYRIIRKDGAIRWIGHACLPVYSPSGQYLGIRGSNRDITQAVQDREELRRLKEHHEGIVQNMKDGVVITDDRGMIIFVNREFADMLGYGLLELIGRPWLETVPSEVQDIVRAADERRKKGRTDRYELTLLRKDGVRVPALVGGNARLDPYTGQFLGTTGVITDISDLKRAEAVLRDQESFYRTILANISDAVFLTDEAGNLVYVCPNVRIIFGRSEEDIRGLGNIQAVLGSTLITPGELPNIGDEVRNRECTIQDSQGRDQHLLVSIKRVTSFPLHDNCAYLYCCRNITERIRLQHKLSQARKMESLGVLAAGIAHDFRNILGAINGYTQLALGSSEAPGVRRDLYAITTAVERARDLVGQVLAFSRQTPAQLRPVRLAGVVREVMDQIRTTCPENIALHTHLDEKNDQALADPVRMHQVVFNLCINAVQAMTETGGSLRVSLNRRRIAVNNQHRLPPGCYVKLTVADTGLGIPREIMDRIFDPFFTTRQQIFGSGLGLAMVHGIVQDHGGTIEVRGGPGQGATFVVLIPGVDSGADMRG